MSRQPNGPGALLSPPSASETQTKFLSDSLLTYGSEIASAGLIFVNGVITARALGASGRGAYAVLVLVPTTLVTLGGLGFFQGIVHGTVKEPETFGRRAANAILFSLAIGALLIALGLATFRLGLLEQLTEASDLSRGLALLTLPVMLLGPLARALVLGTDDLVKRNILALTEPGLFLVAAAVLLLGLGMGVEGAMIAWAISIWGGMALGMVFVLPRALATGLTVDGPRLSRDLKFGIQAYGGTVAGFLLHRQDQFLVAYFLTSAAVGQYVVAYTLVMMMGILPNAVQASLLPKVTAAYYQSGESESLTPFVCRVMTLLSGVLALLAALAAYPVVLLFYGREFLPAVGAFLVLLPAITFLAGMSALNSAMQARSAQKWMSVAAAGALVVNFLLDLVMIPAWGILGAALASSIAYVLMVVIVAWAFLRIDHHLRWGDLLLPHRGDWDAFRRAAHPIARRLGLLRG